jgi:predicted TIM-barrel fold metal-dependent hydrolase
MEQSTMPPDSDPLVPKVECTQEPVTDCHVHIFGSSLDQRFPNRRHPEEAASLVDLERVSLSLGVRRYVVTQPSFLQFDNSLILEALAARPDNLRGVVWLEERHDPNSLLALKAQGVAGLRFPMFHSENMPKWDAYSDIFDAAAECNMHIELGLFGEELIDVTHKVLGHGAKLVVAHLGMFDRELGPDQDSAFAALLETAHTGRVWVKLSAPYRASAAFVDRACERILETFGPERAVWGSDWPHVGPRLDRQVTYPQALSWLQRSVADKAVQRQILSKSPEELYGFAPQTTRLKEQK